MMSTYCLGCTFKSRNDSTTTKTHLSSTTYSGRLLKRICVVTTTHWNCPAFLLHSVRSCIPNTGVFLVGKAVRAWLLLRWRIPDASLPRVNGEKLDAVRHWIGATRCVGKYMLYSIHDDYVCCDIIRDYQLTFTPGRQTHREKESVRLYNYESRDATNPAGFS